MSRDAVILAAGMGRRMGGPKALLDLGGTTLLELQLRALQGARFIIIVVSPELWEARPGPILDASRTRYVLNPRPEEGPFLSIRLGLEALDGGGPVLVVPVDCPVPPGAPQRLSGAAAPGLAWLAPTHDGRRGHPVLLTASGRRRAMDAGADATLRDLLDATPGTAVAVASPLVRCNLNTPSDRDRFLAEHPDWPDLPPGGAP